MRIYWIVLLASFIGGGFGAWALWSDSDQYTGTLRTYSQVDVMYEHGSFAWQDPEFNEATLRLLVSNQSPVAATIENIDLSIAFDTDFAGSSYERFTPVELAAGEERLLEFRIEVTAGSVRAQGGTAMINVYGNMSVAFEGIDREYNLDIGDSVGIVPWSTS